MEREQEPVLIVEETGIHLLLHERVLRCELGARVRDLDGLSGLVFSIVRDLVRLRLPDPGAGELERAEIDVERVADRVDLTERVETVRLGNLVGHGRALLRGPRPCRTKDSDQQNTNDETAARVAHECLLRALVQAKRENRHASCPHWRAMTIVVQALPALGRSRPVPRCIGRRRRSPRMMGQYRSGRSSARSSFRRPAQPPPQASRSSHGSHAAGTLRAARNASVAPTSGPRSRSTESGSPGPRQYTHGCTVARGVTRTVPAPHPPSLRGSPSTARTRGSPTTSTSVSEKSSSKASQYCSYVSAKTSVRTDGQTFTRRGAPYRPAMAATAASRRKFVRIITATIVTGMPRRRQRSACACTRSQFPAPLCASCSSRVG